MSISAFLVKFFPGTRPIKHLIQIRIEMNQKFEEKDSLQPQTALHDNCPSK